MSSVTLSAAVRSNLLSLQNTAALLETTQTRLATGNRVNSALDNPTNYFTASELNTRAGDLGNLLDSVSNAIQTIDAANNGISAISKIVEDAQATANQAQQLSATATGGSSTVTGTTVIAADTPASITSTVSGITPSDTIWDLAGDDSSLTLDVSGTQLTIDFHNTFHSGPYTGSNPWVDTDDGTHSPKPMSTALGDIQNAIRGSGVAGTSAATVTLDGGGHLVIGLGTDTTHTLSVVSDTTASSPTGGTGLGLTGQSGSPGNTTLGALSGTLTLGGNTLTFGSGPSQINTRAELTSALGGLTGGITGSIDGSGHLKFDGTGSFTVAGTLDANAAFGIADQTYSGNATVPNPARAALVTQYNGLLDQIDQLAEDSSYNGNNLLTGAATLLKVVFNETGTSSLTIAGKDASTSGLGLTQLGSTAFDANGSISTVLDQLKSAQDTLRADASSFGSNLSIVQTRQDFTKALINTLQTGASNLTLADPNEETANLLALQTRQSLSTKALALASQSDQNVLRLLQ